MVVCFRSGDSVSDELEARYIFIGLLALHAGVIVAPVEWAYADRAFNGVLKES